MNMGWGVGGISVAGERSAARPGARSQRLNAGRDSG